MRIRSYQGLGIWEKFNLTSITGGSVIIIVSLAVDFTTANTADNNIYDKIISVLAVTIIRKRS